MTTPIGDRFRSHGRRKSPVHLYAFVVVLTITTCASATRHDSTQATLGSRPTAGKLSDSSAIDWSSILGGGSPKDSGKTKIGSNIWEALRCGAPGQTIVAGGSLELGRNESMILLCSAKKSSAPPLSWERLNVNHKLESINETSLGGRISIETSDDGMSSRLRIVNVEESDSGHYKCLNRDGQYVCGTGVVIGGPPVKYSNLSCESFQHNGVTCTWRRGDRYLDSDARTRYHLSWRLLHTPQYQCELLKHDNEFVTWSCLKGIGNITVNELDPYPTFQAFQQIYLNITGTTPFGNESWLHVIQPRTIIRPAAPSDVGLLHINSTSATLTWGLDRPMGDIPLRYEIQLRSEYDIRASDEEAENIEAVDIATTSWRNASTDFLVNVSSTIIRPSFEFRLLPFTHYEFRLRCKPKNDGYWSDYSRPFAVRSLATRPIVAPRSIPGAFEDHAINVTHKRIILYWSQLTQQQQNGPAFHYSAKYTWFDSEHRERKIVGLSEVPYANASFTVPARRSFGIVDPLEVRAVNSEGTAEEVLRDRIFPSGLRVARVTVLKSDAGYNITWLVVTPADKQARLDVVRAAIVYWCRSTLLPPYPCIGPLKWKRFTDANATGFGDDRTRGSAVMVLADNSYQFAVGLESAMPGDGTYAAFGVEGSFSLFSGLRWTRCVAWENDLNLRLRSVEAESVANASLHVHWGLDCEDLTGLVSGYKVYYIACANETKSADSCFERVRLDPSALINSVTVAGNKAELHSGSSQSTDEFIFNSTHDRREKGHVFLPNPDRTSVLISGLYGNRFYAVAATALALDGSESLLSELVVTKTHAWTPSGKGSGVGVGVLGVALGVIMASLAVVLACFGLRFMGWYKDAKKACADIMLPEYPIASGIADVEIDGAFRAGSAAGTTGTSLADTGLRCYTPTHDYCDIESTDKNGAGDSYADFDMTALDYSTSEFHPAPILPLVDHAPDVESGDPHVNGGLRVGSTGDSGFGLVMENSVSHGGLSRQTSANPSGGGVSLPQNGLSDVTVRFANGRRRRHRRRADSSDMEMAPGSDDRNLDDTSLGDADDEDEDVVDCGGMDGVGTVAAPPVPGAPGRSARTVAGEKSATDSSTRYRYSPVPAGGAAVDVLPPEKKMKAIGARSGSRSPLAVASSAAEASLSHAPDEQPYNPTSSNSGGDSVGWSASTSAAMLPSDRRRLTAGRHTDGDRNGKMRHILNWLGKSSAPSTAEAPNSGTLSESPGKSTISPIERWKWRLPARILGRNNAPSILDESPYCVTPGAGDDQACDVTGGTSYTTLSIGAASEGTDARRNVPNSHCTEPRNANISRTRVAADDSPADSYVPQVESCYGGEPPNAMTTTTMLSSSESYAANEAAKGQQSSRARENDSKKTTRCADAEYGSRGVPDETEADSASGNDCIDDAALHDRLRENAVARHDVRAAGGFLGGGSCYVANPALVTEERQTVSQPPLITSQQNDAVINREESHGCSSDSTSSRCPQSDDDIGSLHRADDARPLEADPAAELVESNSASPADAVAVDSDYVAPPLP